MKMIRVIAKKDGFRRAGRAWSGTTEVPVADFTKSQIEQLKNEPMLVVQEFEAPDEKSDTKDAGTGTGKGTKGPAGGKDAPGKAAD